MASNNLTMAQGF
jgi:hypothetical protein